MPAEVPAQTIVIADDDNRNREDYEAMLQPLGCTIVPLQSKEEVYEYCAGNPPPDLVLLDLWFPDMEDGLEACRRLREASAHSEVAIVMITAVGHDPNNLQRCIEAGADDFLVRGVAIVELLQRVSSKLRAQRAIRQLVERERELVERKLDAERLKALSEFVRSVKHDVGNALNVIEVVFEDFNTSRDRLQTLKASVEQQIAALERTFNDNHGQLAELQYLVNLQVQALQALAMSGGAEPQDEVDIRALVNDAYTLARKQAQPSVVRLECPPDLDAKVTAYRFGLLFSLREMVLNASSFIRQHGETHKTSRSGHIILKAERVEIDGRPAVRIIVADDGPGVREELRDRIFEQGFRSRPGISEPGGWGLYAAKMRVEKAGGTLRHEPNQPQGAVFIIELPVP